MQKKAFRRFLVNSTRSQLKHLVRLPSLRGRASESELLLSRYRPTIACSLTNENYLALRHCRAAGFFYTDRKLGGRCHGVFRPELEAGRIPAFDWNNASTDWSLLSRIDNPKLIIVSRLKSRQRF